MRFTWLLSPLVTALTSAAFSSFAAGGQAGDSLVIDDRSTGTATSALGPVWRFFSDGVMGGVSTGAMTVETVNGRPALCLRGQVRLENNGGFVQMALELPALSEGASWRGVELDVLGNGRRYGAHLRTRGMMLPWQAYRSSFAAGPEWHTVRLPFESFEPYRTSGPLKPASIRRVGIVAIGERFEADICIARFSLYR